MDQGQYPYNVYFNGNVEKQIAAKTFPQCRDMVQINLEGSIGKEVGTLVGDRQWEYVTVDKKYVDAKMKEYDDAWKEANPPPKPPPVKKVTAPSSTKKKS